MGRTPTTYLQSDLDAIAAMPDGDLVYVDFIGFEVPSFIDPRYDLVQPGQVAKTDHLNHHVPFALRGPFRPTDLHDKDLWVGKTNEEGYCICNGKKKDGLPCRQTAMNRSQFCSTHGGRLHPADRQAAKLPAGLLPDIAQIRKYTRAQKVQMGLIPIAELSDEEIVGQFVWDDDGRKVSSRKLTDRIHADMVREMMTRMNDKLAKGLPDVLDTMLEMATDPIVEPADRIKASIWWAERVIGKTPDVVIHGKTDKPVDQIFAHLETTSRDDYRRAIESERVIEGVVVEDGDYGPVSDGPAPHADADAFGSDQTGRNDHQADSVRMDDLDAVRTTNAGADLDGLGFDGVRDVPESGDDDDDGQASAAANRAATLADRRKRLAALKAEQSKAKNRRYAARAQGLTGTSDVGWVIEYKPAGKSPNFFAKLYPPDAITPELLGRIETAETLRSLEAASA